MLIEISIKNFAIIKEVHLAFDKGMTVLTGETGAGKSIIIDAMNLLLGARATLDVIRHGTDKAEIEGLFLLEGASDVPELLRANGLEVTEELVIRREILANGRSVSRINGRLVNLSLLKEVGQYLVDIHGQHDQEELMRAKHHIALLDSFGGEDFWQLKADYQSAFTSYRTLRKQIRDKQKNEEEHKARIEMLEYQIAEIEAAELTHGEEETLKTEHDKLLNYKQIADTLVNVYTMLDNDEFSSLSNIRSAMNDMESLENYDSEYKDLSENLTNSYYILEDVAKRLEDVIDDMDFDSNRLLQIESRLSVLHSITRKYGGQIEDVLAYLEAITQEYDHLTGAGQSSEDLSGQLKEKEKEVVELSVRLSKTRHAMAASLEEEIHQELQDLYMEKARFKVQFTKGKFNREGNEEVEFYIAANPGEDFKPLVKVASGGELSRLMLAVKSAFSRRADKTSIVFDEVDTGVSGRVAQAIAQKIYKIGQHGQVLAISHLPQVIAIADNQFFIEKVSDKDTTVSQVRLLDEEERVEEIAKMLAGEKVSDTARKQARELLQRA